ncbi:MAG: hypothetical protein AAFU65_13450 [Pseudomonadota bacterium]
MNTQASVSDTVSTYPMVVVGLDTTTLTPQALAIERDQRFKCVLIRHVEDKIGTLNLQWRNKVRSRELLSGNLDEDGARQLLQQFLEDQGGDAKVSIGSVRSSCHATPTGWIRDWPFTMIRLDTDSLWTCDEAVEIYYRDEIGKPVPKSIKDAFRELFIKLIVVDQFDVVCK